MNWINVTKQLPPENIFVDTKINDTNGVRNIQSLKLYRNLWWLPDICNHPGHSMYVYYRPTHWRYQPTESTCP